jgi:glycerol kinase
VTDVTNASRTMLMNLKTLQWDSSACEYIPHSSLTAFHIPHAIPHSILTRLLVARPRVFGIPMSILPRIRSSAEEYGHIISGPLAGVPLTCVRAPELFRYCYCYCYNSHLNLQS